MVQYVVISLNVGGLHNQIFKTGDIVNVGHFPDGHIDSLLENGHLRKATEEDIQKVKEGVEEVKEIKTKASTRKGK